MKARGDLRQRRAASARPSSRSTTYRVGVARAFRRLPPEPPPEPPPLPARRPSPSSSPSAITLLSPRCSPPLGFYVSPSLQGYAKRLPPSSPPPLSRSSPEKSMTQRLQLHGLRGCRSKRSSSSNDLAASSSMLLSSHFLSLPSSLPPSPACSVSAALRVSERAASGERVREGPENE